MTQAIKVFFVVVQLVTLKFRNSSSMTPSGRQRHYTACQESNYSHKPICLWTKILLSERLFPIVPSACRIHVWCRCTYDCVPYTPHRTSNLFNDWEVMLPGTSLISTHSSLMSPSPPGWRRCVFPTGVQKKRVFFINIFSDRYGGPTVNNNDHRLQFNDYPLSFGNLHQG